MRTSSVRFGGLVMGALLVVGARSSLAGPEGPEPTDRYAKVLAGKKLEEGRGFVGLLEFGQALPGVVQHIGEGRQLGGLWPSWTAYDKGDWKLSVITRPDLERSPLLRRVEVLVLEGASAPATGRGIRIGDPVTKVAEAYGTSPTRLEGSVDNPGEKGDFFVLEGIEFGEIDVAGGEIPDFAERLKFDISTRMGNYYADAGILLTFDEGKVNRIIAFLRPDPVPIWMRDQPDPPRPWLAVTKEGITKPTWEKPKAEGDARGLLLLPMPPDVSTFLLQDVTVPVPAGWQRDGDMWVSPCGAETLVVERELPEPGETAEEWFDYTASFTGGMLTDPAQRKVPQVLLDRMGADAGRTYHFQAASGETEPWPQRTWVLLLSKEDRYFRISLSRTVAGENPSPDGMELARRVLRGVRISP